MNPAQCLRDDDFVRLLQRAVALPDAPGALVRAAIGLWPVAQRADLKAAAQAALRLVRAVLSFDSWAQSPLSLGVRGGAVATRQLLFSAQGRDIDLRISPMAEHFALAGQILGPEEAGMVELSTPFDPAAANQGARVASLDALGEFRLEGVRGGTYRMTLRMGGDEIVLPPIEVGARGTCP
jgi:hypothetical protein